MKHGDRGAFILLLCKNFFLERFYRNTGFEKYKFHEFKNLWIEVFLNS